MIKDQMEKTIDGLNDADHNKIFAGYDLGNREMIVVSRKYHMLGGKSLEFVAPTITKIISMSQAEIDLANKKAIEVFGEFPADCVVLLDSKTGFIVKRTDSRKAWYRAAKKTAKDLGFSGMML